ncbi:MAG: aminotransferase class IV [Pseudomonadota bacterium]
MPDATEPKIDWSKGAAWMDGRYMPISDAKIGVLDWGFIHSDVSYDVVHVWDGAFFRLNDHLDRFREGMAAQHMAVSQSREEMSEILHGCVAQSGLRESYVAMVCTRGELSVPGSRDPRDCENRFFAYALPFIWVITPEAAQRGARMLISKSTRRIPSDSVDPTIKNYHWGDFTRGLFEAKQAGFDSVILLDHAGNVTEGPGFNVFCIKDGRVITPDAGHLMGVSRRTVLEMAEELGMPVEVRPVPVAEFYEADEVFLSTTGGGVRPVAQVDDRIYSNGAPGVQTMRLHDHYWRWHAEGRYCEPVRYDCPD